MANFSFFILYVRDVAISEAFYTDLLGRPAVQSGPGFSMFAASPGVMLGLWRQGDVAPKATTPGGGETCITVDTQAEVEAMAEAWAAKGVPIAQTPTQMVFGYTFVGLDPDGHRLRVFMPAR